MPRWWRRAQIVTITATTLNMILRFGAIAKMCSGSDPNCSGVDAAALAPTGSAPTSPWPVAADGAPSAIQAQAAHDALQPPAAVEKLPVTEVHAVKHARHFELPHV